MEEDLDSLDDDMARSNIRTRNPTELRKWELWTSYEVCAWIGTFQKPLIAPLFFKAGITGAHLKNLTTTEDLAKTVGIKDKGDQLSILAKIQKLMSENPL